jgi:hypothetical protein
VIKEAFSRRCCSASTAASNNSWSVNCFIPPDKSLDSKYRDDKAAVVAAFVNAAGRGGFADDEEASRNDAVEIRSAFIGRVRPLTNDAATNVMEQHDCGTCSFQWVLT